MSTPLTNIRVFINWEEQAAFAGEDIECRLTFKNIATSPAPSRTFLQPPTANGLIAGGDRNRRAPAVQSKRESTTSPRPNVPSQGHRTILSLNVPAGPNRSLPTSSAWSGGPPKSARNGAHKRSVSIISLGAATNNSRTDEVGGQGKSAERPRPLMRGHGRSASLQIIPRRSGNGGPASAPLNQRSSTQPSPLMSPDGGDHIHRERPARRQAGVATAPSTPHITGTGTPFLARKGSASSPQNFRFPASPVDLSEKSPEDHHNHTAEAPNFSGHSRLLSPRSRDNIPIITEKMVPSTRILSPASVTGTPRSSGEFYSLSNNSTETLASEYQSQQPARTSTYGGHIRRPSNLVPTNHHRPPETLMMGYAQIHGSFTLDSSLISQTSFEEVKRKGAVGGQGGGVIGIESSKRESSLLRGFGWGSFGESLGGILGSGELSSIKDMRDVTSSRSIPLLTTPQSILFVDLRLSPGESKTFKYSFKLPRGLPPSHRGKAIKISYKLIIGTQRPGGAKEQQIKFVEIPFRILGSVNSHGELLGHNLMSPYILLRDNARVQAIETPVESTQKSSNNLTVKTSPTSAESSLDDFLSYVDELLTKPRLNSSLGLLSPTEAPRSRRQSSVDEPATAKDAIDMAILRSNIATESRQSANRFEIARSGKRVAVIMLARPAYRLGETITAAIDFVDAQIPCYAIHASLETSEKVDNSIALRSEASILRVTRKVYVSHSESALCARRIFFSPTIPISATPEFITSGVTLDWRIRIEFVTPRHGGVEGTQGYTNLLEEISGDNRNVVLAAAEALDCETFEIAVPIRVFGALSGNGERDEDSSEGLVV